MFSILSERLGVNYCLLYPYKKADTIKLLNYLLNFLPTVNHQDRVGKLVVLRWVYCALSSVTAVWHYLMVSIAEIL